MIGKIILAILFGVLMGMGIWEKLNKNSVEINHTLITSQENLIKTYEEYIRYLEEEHINAYKDVLNETLKQNINLKKKLKAYE